MKNCFLIALIITVLSIPGASLAHGTRIEHTTSTAIQITAFYDSGGPMSGAQVAVFSPDNPSKPWITGVCDENGKFSFTPNMSNPGSWDVQVRLAGHGDIIHIPVGKDMEQSASTGFSSMQIIIMAACVIWGFVGTTLFFLRRNASNAHS